MGLPLIAAACVFWLFAQHAAADAGGLRTMQYTARDKAAAVAWQKELRTELAGLLKLTDLLAGETAIPLNPKTLSSENKGRYVMHEMEISATSTQRIRVVLTVPTGQSGPFPAVIAVAGHGGDRHTCYVKASYKRCAHMLAGRGYVTISTRVSQHKVREKGSTLLGERLWDLMRCADYLASRDDVDANRIGCLGNSLGGEMVMWLAAMDERMTASLSSGFLTQMDQLEKNHCMCWKLPGLRELVDFADIYSLIAPRALLCQNGLKEPASQFPVSLAREAMKEIQLIYHDFDRPGRVALVAHDGGHEIDLPSLLAFFDKHLREKS